MTAFLFSVVVFSFGLFEKDLWWAISRSFVAFIFFIALEGLYLSYVMYSITAIAKSFYDLFSLVLS